MFVATSEVWTVSPDQQWPIADSYLHLFVSWTSGCDCQIMLTYLHLWTVSPD